MSCCRGNGCRWPTRPAVKPHKPRYQSLGYSSGEIAAYVIEYEPKCFIFGTGAGQTARLQLFGSNNACFTFKDVIDCQDDYSFRTQRRNYEVGVFQLFPRRSYEEVTLRLTIR